MIDDIVTTDIASTGGGYNQSSSIDLLLLNDKPRAQP